MYASQSSNAFYMSAHLVILELITETISCEQQAAINYVKTGKNEYYIAGRNGRGDPLR
jgi:hypothetical protein